MKKYLDPKQHHLWKEAHRIFFCFFNLLLKTKWQEKINIIKWKMWFCDAKNFYLIERKTRKFLSRKKSCNRYFVVFCLNCAGNSRQNLNYFKNMFTGGRTCLFVCCGVLRVTQSCNWNLTLNKSIFLVCSMHERK